MNIQQAPLAGVDFSLVGPGKVGSSLAHWIVSKGARLTSVAARSQASSRQLIDKLGGHFTSLERLSSADDDLLLVAVSDPALADVIQTLADCDQATVTLHTSGRFPGEILAALRRGDRAIGSIHPLKAFPRVLSSAAAAEGTVFGIDGDPKARALAQRLALACSGVPVEIPPSARSLYHLSATIAAGGVVTLLASTAELAETLELDPAVIDGYLELARGALLQARNSESVGDAITGPVARGDFQGHQAQIAELRAIDPDLADLLDLLAQRTLHHRRKLLRS